MNWDTIWDYFFRLVKQQMEGISYETLFALILVEIILVNLICFVYARFTGNPVKIMTRIVWCVLIGYGCFIYMVTFDRREAGSRNGIFTTLDFGSLKGDFMATQQFVYSFLNIVLFVPWGVALTAIKRNGNILSRTIMVILYCFLTSFCIETMQLVTKKGYFELTDIVTNITGGIVGCILANIIIEIAFAVHRSQLDRR